MDIEPKVKTADEQLNDIATKAGVEVNDILRLASEKLKSDTSFQKKMQEMFEEERKATQKRNGFIVKRNEELQALITNSELEQAWVDIQKKRHEQTRTSEIVTPKMEIITPPKTPIIMP